MCSISQTNLIKELSFHRASRGMSVPWNLPLGNTALQLRSDLVEPAVGLLPCICVKHTQYPVFVLYCVLSTGAHTSRGGDAKETAQKTQMPSVCIRR